MIDPLEDWADRLLQMKPVGSAQAGAQNLADFYGDMADKVSAEGSNRLFTFNRTVFVSTLLAQGFAPTGGTDWVQRVGTAYLAGVASATILPGQKNDGRWSASGSDVVTPNSGAAVIITAITAKEKLEEGLLASSVGFTDIGKSSQADDFFVKFAQAWRDATLEFKFKLIGLIISGPTTAPLPLVFEAQ